MLESKGDADVQPSLVLDAAADTACCYAAGRVVRTNRVRESARWADASDYDEAIRVYYRESGHVDKVRLLRCWKLGACGRGEESEKQPSGRARVVSTHRWTDFKAWMR